MTSVFLSYSHEDEARARVIKLALRGKGHDVFWDEDIPVGDNWRDTLRDRVFGCQCTIVAWTPAAAASQYVRAEVDVAADSDRLIPALLENVDLPQQFKDLQAADLRNWIGNILDPEWQKVEALVEDYASLVVKNPEGEKPLFDGISDTSTPDPGLGADTSEPGKWLNFDLAGVVERFVRSALTLSPLQEDAFKDITSIRVEGKQAFAAEVQGLRKHGYVIVEEEPGQTLLERKRRFNWLVAAMLTLVFVIPALVYVLVFPFLPKVHRLYVVQVK